MLAFRVQVSPVFWSTPVFSRKAKFGLAAEQATSSSTTGSNKSSFFMALPSKCAAFEHLADLFFIRPFQDAGFQVLERHRKFVVHIGGTASLLPDLGEVGRQQEFGSKLLAEFDGAFLINQAAVLLGLEFFDRLRIGGPVDKAEFAGTDQFCPDRVGNRFCVDMLHHLVLDLVDADDRSP